MSSVSSGSSWSSHSRSSSGASVRYREARLPNTPAINSLIYFTGRNPRHVKKVRVVETTYPDEEFEVKSSGRSVYSTSSRKKKKDVSIMFVESRRSYWDYEDDSISVRRVSTKKSGRSSRASRRSTWEEEEVDDESDDGSEMSAEPIPGPPPMGMPHPGMGGFAGRPPPGAFMAVPPGAGGVPGPRPGFPPGHPGMAGGMPGMAGGMPRGPGMPPMGAMRGPPPGAFQPVPRPGPGA